MTLEVGRIYVIHSSVTVPPKEKICLCVCDERQWFFFINTKPHFIAGHSVPVASTESDALDYDSHLDISSVFAFQPHELAARKVRGYLEKTAIERAIEALAAGVKKLPKLQAEQVIAKLSSLYSTDQKNEEP